MAEQPDLPCEVLEDDPTCRVRSLEQRMVRIFLWAMPLTFLGALVGFAQFGKTVLFLHPPRHFATVMTSRLGLVAALATMLIIPVWWFSLRITKLSSRGVQTIACMCLTLLGIVATNIVLENPRAAWIFQEAVKARTPQLNFARNIVFVQQHLHLPKQDKAESASSLKIGLVGSSQINLGVDSGQLAAELDEAKVAKICLPGMVPLQYAALGRDIDAQKFDVVVCWLSEFDFFREQTLPTSRLRWCCDLANFQALLSTLSGGLIWNSRSDMADLAVATQVGIWQQRELFQMLAFRFWWRFDAETTTASKEEIQIGARLGNRKQGITNARKNIARTPLLETNFAAFRQFRKHVTASGAQLIVLEGECHPDTMVAYDKTFRPETRSRLKRLAADERFLFVEADERFDIEESDWSDAVHLNEAGRSKLTSFLASLIKRQTSDHISNLNLEN